MIIDSFLYYRVFKTNKIDKEYDKIREAIINNKNKLRDIIFNKCVITNEILYHKDRL